ncbi:hypothetical protein [Actinokineospora cianjurensis]|uniref:Uncharacterized protein n=1 Tax=Actinokineospora cianjurensis TaxID=585224 RepID=A0A421B3I8_9PSEU|nr:hypothetical protein [Actinokineospora cianjurensis]RLK58924.1 hypothetical protein CLV68_3405 [Actinokineospora cianjurensis]
MRPLWTERLDDGFDRYVLEREDVLAPLFGEISPVPFACAVWRLAGPPAVDPGYLRRHPRVLSADLDPSGWDGTLTASVSIAAPWPATLAWPRDWSADRGWRDWPTLFGQYVDPTDRDIATVPHLRSTLLVQAPIPFTDLPPAPHSTDAVPEAARLVLTTLVRELNALLTPLLTRLDTAPKPT